MLWQRKIIVRDDQIGLVFKDGSFARQLPPGRHELFDPGNQLVIDLVQTRITLQPNDLAGRLEKSAPEVFNALFERVVTSETELAEVYYDGKLATFISPNKEVFISKAWQTPNIIRHDVASLASVPTSRIPVLKANCGAGLSDVLINQHQIGLLMANGRLERSLPPGRYGFWAYVNDIQVKTFDLRPQPAEITAQEMLTKDKVSLRVTLTAYVQIEDAEKLIKSVPDHMAYVYRLAQFGVREAIGGRTLDEVLADRKAVDAEIDAYVQNHLGDQGFSVREVTIKDIILPGDMREILNRVVEAEKQAQANLIRRREETAATRSLLNTARLMEDSPILLRLKELEALERVVEKVHRIDLHASTPGTGFDALMHSLVKLKE